VLVRIATVAAVISLGLAPAALADSSTPSTLTVEGQGSVMVTPDLGTLSVSVTRSAATSAEALSAANRRSDAIVGAVRHLGVPAAEIQTESVTTACGRIKTGPKGHTHLIRQCTASESDSITAKTAILGEVIDAATRAGANDISGPDFSFADPSEGEIAAENAAITDAEAQASAAAAQIGDTVTGVQSVDLNPQDDTAGSSGSTGSTLSAAPVPAATPTTVSPGQQEVDATVSIVFTIAPAAAN
jgi:uncharacterized protein YggE